MTALTYTGATPTVNADADTWGAEINTSLGQISTDLGMLNTTPTSTMLGRVTAATGEVERLTGTQATTLLVPLVGASQTVAGTKGIVPQPLAGEQNRVLGGDGTWRNNLGPAFKCVITTTGLAGSQPTFVAGQNVASLSLVTVSGSYSATTITFTTALPSTAYGILGTGNGNQSNDGIVYTAKAVGSFNIGWDNTGGAMTEISVFGFL